HGSGPNNVWASGLGGELAHFDGSVWAHSSTGLGDDIQQLWVISPTDVWARVSGGLQHFTGGAWAKDSTARNDVTGIWASGSSDVWAIGSGSANVQRWNGSAWVDGGAATANPILIHGSSASDVWVFASDGKGSHWNGTDWTDVTLDQTDEPEVKGLFVRAPNDAWLVGKTKFRGPLVGHWNGVDWTLVDHPGLAISELTQVLATAPNDVWVLDDRGSGQYFDGVQWTPFDAQIFALYFAATGESFALSNDHLKILRNRGQVVAKMPFDPGQVGWYVFSTLDGHTFVSEQGGTTGYITHHDGLQWLAPEQICSQLVRVIWGAAGNDVWASCGSNLLRWDGAQWKQTTPPSPVMWMSMWGSSSSDIWAGGLSGNVIHYDGQNWTHRDLVPAVEPTDRVDWISGTGPSDVWAGTVQNLLFHWTGSSWTKYTPGFYIGAMVSTAPNEVMIADVNNSKVVQRGNGTTWTALPLPDDFTGYVYKLGAAARDDVFGSNGSDTFVHFNGTEWTLVKGDPVSELSINARSIVYISGDQLTRLIRVRPWSCRNSEAGFCNDGIDNDCDAKLDHLDNDCP
ncbi:MAG TPA: hypothetical protein VL326_22655, partial [Kofleriaceae bacterium]|nr:hypothetical protein [Kofleriaceae bacterium]